MRHALTSDLLYLYVETITDDNADSRDDAEMTTPVLTAIQTGWLKTHSTTLMVQLLNWSNQLTVANRPGNKTVDSSAAERRQFVVGRWAATL